MKGSEFMKIRRNIRLSYEVYDEFIEYCKKYKYKYSSLISYIIAKDLELLNSDSVPALKTYDDKKTFQINIDEELYDNLKSSKVARIEWAIKRFLREQEKNNGVII